MKISGIYKIQSKVKPERIYIGSAVNFKQRRYNHLNLLRNNLHANKKLQKHFNKYGEADLQFMLLLACDKKDLISHEQFFIDSFTPSFNICKTAGNTLGRIVTEETRKKMSMKLMGNTRTLGKKFGPLSEQIRKKLSEAHKGNTARRGKKTPEDVKEKLRKANSGEKSYWLGKHLTEGMKKKISIANRGNKFCLGRKMSDETKKKISESLKGEKHPMYGKHFTEEHKRKIGEASKGKKLSIEARKKISLSRKGKKISEETRLKLIAAGKKRKHSPEELIRMGEAQKKAWIIRKQKKVA